MTMTAAQLRDLLRDVPDTREIVICRDAAEDELVAAWREAHAEATQALDRWRAAPGADAFAVYRAAADRADAASEAIAG